MPRKPGTPARRKSVLSIRWIVAGAAAILTTLVVLASPPSWNGGPAPCS